MRDECLNPQYFDTLPAARAAIEQWRAAHNTARPHSGLGRLTPAGYVARLTIPMVVPTPDASDPAWT